jgi:transcriptional regulator with XRE-family HTH domain
MCKSLGARLTQLRQRQARACAPGSMQIWTREFVAAKVGTTVDSVKRWEKDRHMPSSDNVMKLADLYEVNAQQLANLGDATVCVTLGCPVEPVEGSVVDARQPTLQPAGPRIRIRYAGAGVALLVLFVGLVYNLTLYSRVMPAFQPAWIGKAHPNASADIRIYRLDNAPGSLDWYEYDGEEKPPIFVGRQSLGSRDIRLSHYVSYRSTLMTDDDYSWTGLFLHRLPYLPDLGLFRWRLPEDGVLLLVLESERDDCLEIGLKDEGGGERKIALAVRRDWAGYRVPLRAFRNVNRSGIDLLILARSRTIGSVSENALRIAALVAR